MKPLLLNVKLLLLYYYSYISSCKCMCRMLSHCGISLITSSLFYSKHTYPQWHKMHYQKHAEYWVDPSMVTILKLYPFKDLPISFFSPILCSLSSYFLIFFSTSPPSLLLLPLFDSSSLPTLALACPKGHPYFIGDVSEACWCTDISK